MTEQFDFQAEVAKLLHMMIHSVYSEKDVFLRELISNASDACDRLRYQAITKPELLGDDPDLKIILKLDISAQTLTIQDNGIGMSKKDLIDNLGTIARSGTKAFLEKMSKEKEATSLIGQFGVGFYSAFMVADNVEVTSKKAGAKACTIWRSKGGNGFSIEAAPTEIAKAFERGTKIVLHLNADSQKYLEPLEIERIVSTYSDHISFPIILEAQKSETSEKDSEENETEQDQEIQQDKQLNTGSALWTRAKSDITEQEYTNFYKQVAVPFDEPTHTLHYQAEGRHEYSVLLFVPTLKPFDLYEPERKGRIKLYVKRVFITEDADILPPYLRFMRGVIDSQDIPLNISREMLQNNPIVQSIKRAVTKKIISEFRKIASKDAEKFNKIWETFGPVIKEGLYEDFELRDDLFEVARFHSSKSSSWRSLKEYVADMHDNQDGIYYLTGDTLDRLNASPLLEGFRARNLEVLLLADQVDNFWVINTLGFEGKPFKSLTQGDVDLANIPLADGKEEKQQDQVDAKAAALIAKIKQTLGDAISDVQVSKRLVNSPVCLVAPAGGPDRGLDKIINYSDSDKRMAPVLEVNMSHDILQKLRDKMEQKTEQAEFEDHSWLLLDQAKILEGELPSDPLQFSERLNRVMFAKDNSA